MTNTPKLPADCDPAQLQRFLDTYMYRPEAFLLDEIFEMETSKGRMQARLDTAKPLPYSDLQRSHDGHPAHVSASDVLMLTGSLGCLHAWFFHDCYWDEGWAGFGSRIHRADFKGLITRGPELLLTSRETSSRNGKRRVVLRYDFEFYQQDKLVYVGDQTAMFVKDWGFEAE